MSFSFIQQDEGGKVVQSWTTWGQQVDTLHSGVVRPVGHIIAYNCMWKKAAAATISLW